MKNFNKYSNLNESELMYQRLFESKQLNNLNESVDVIDLGDDTEEERYKWAKKLEDIVGKKKLQIAIPAKNIFKNKNDLHLYAIYVDYGVDFEDSNKSLDNDYDPKTHFITLNYDDSDWEMAGPNCIGLYSTKKKRHPWFAYQSWKFEVKTIKMIINFINKLRKEDISIYADFYQKMLNDEI